MEFPEVVRHRKMWRTFQDRSVDPEVLGRILDIGRRAPSAGFSQGFAFLLFEGRDETARFWDVVSHKHEWPGEGLRRAPVILVPLAGKDVYLERYAEPDKGWTDRDEAHWPIPYWVVDSAFSSMLVLLAAVDEGLGALFFGLEAEMFDPFRTAFGVPKEWEPIGVIALGHKDDDPVTSSRDSRPRKGLSEVVHRGRW
jgi:nitroreductase